MDNMINPITFDYSLINHNFIMIDVPGEPFAKQRPRAAKKGRYITIYTPRETKLYEEKVRKVYDTMYNGYPQLEGALTANIEGYFSIPNSVNKKKREQMINGEEPHTKKPDCDNMGKICLDALNGVAYPDDAAINRLNISKEYSETPKVRITIIENRNIK